MSEIIAFELEEVVGGVVRLKYIEIMFKLLLHGFEKECNLSVKGSFKPCKSFPNKVAQSLTHVAHLKVQLLVCKVVCLLLTECNKSLP